VALQQRPSFVSADEYLKGEKDAAVKHEYVDGECYAMVGAVERTTPLPSIWAD
jgi:hypothetical protein